jgi:hypothetical protein
LLKDSQRSSSSSCAEYVIKNTHIQNNKQLNWLKKYPLRIQEIEKNQLPNDANHTKFNDTLPVRKCS